MRRPGIEFTMNLLCEQHAVIDRSCDACRVAEFRWLIDFHASRVRGELHLCAAAPEMALATGRAEIAGACAKRAWTYAWALFAAESPREYISGTLGAMAIGQQRRIA